MEFLPFIAFGIAFVALVAWVVVKGRADRAAYLEILCREGFAPCPAEAEALAEQVAHHENNSEYRYRIRDPLRASIDDESVWFYVKERARQGQVTAAQEFRFRLDRNSPEGLVLFFKPTALRSGTTVTLIGSLATSGWDAQPDDLTRLEVPAELQQSNLIGFLAPAGASLYDLIDPRVLEAMQQVADFGVLVVTCRDDWCSLASSTTRMNLEIEGLLPVVRQLAAPCPLSAAGPARPRRSG